MIVDKSLVRSTSTDFVRSADSLRDLIGIEIKGLVLLR